MGLCVAYGALICRFRALAVYIVLIIRSLRLTQVLPYCILNCCIMALLEWLHSFDNIDLAISDKGHSFMNLMVAFLIVSRVNISVSRYNEARGNLEVMYREARELMQNACILSNHLTDTTAKEWRLLIAYRCMCLLRLSMAVIDYQETRIPVWEIDELAPEEKKAIKATLFYNTDSSSPNAMRWAHEVRNEEEENMRVPVRMAYELRKAIHKQRQLFGDKKLETSQENKLLGSVDSYMSGYYGIRKFLTTPFPFPLVQMARTFLFFYVYTVRARIHICLRESTIIMSNLLFHSWSILLLFATAIRFPLRFSRTLPLQLFTALRFSC